MEKQAEYIIKRGPDTMAERTGQEITAFRFMLPVVQLKHLQRAAAASGISIAEYLRRMIAEDMEG